MPQAQGRQACRRREASTSKASRRSLPQQHDDGVAGDAAVLSQRVHLLVRLSLDVDHAAETRGTVCGPQKLDGRRGLARPRPCLYVPPPNHSYGLVQPAPKPARTHLGCAPSIWHRLSRIASLCGDILGRCKEASASAEGRAVGVRLARVWVWASVCSRQQRQQQPANRTRHGSTPTTPKAHLRCCPRPSLPSTPSPCLPLPPPAAAHLRDDGAVDVADVVAALPHQPHRLLEEDIAAGGRGDSREQ